MLYVNTVFHAFPFLWEMRCALDWTVTPETSLTLRDWFKLEDIYAGLCSVRSTMKAKRAIPKGE